MQTSEFQSQTAIVVGGTSGIGKAAVLALAQAGANVVLTGRRVPEGEGVAEAAKRLGVKAQFVQGDVTNEKDVEHAIHTASALAKQWGGALKYAFNNAGIELGGVMTADSTVEQYRQVFDINVLGVMLCMKHQIRAMLAAGGGSIVNNASIAASVGMPGVGIYCASKHAVLGMTRVAALEVAKQNIRVNSVSPAAIDTDMMTRFTGNRNPDTMNWLTSMHPVGRMGKPEEIADPVLFLLSSKSSFMTGHDLRVDGGFTVQ